MGAMGAMGAIVVVAPIGPIGPTPTGGDRKSRGMGLGWGRFLRVRSVGVGTVRPSHRWLCGGIDSGAESDAGGAVNHAAVHLSAKGFGRGAARAVAFARLAASAARAARP